MTAIKMNTRLHVLTIHQDKHESCYQQLAVELFEFMQVFKTYKQGNDLYLNMTTVHLSL